MENLLLARLDAYHGQLAPVDLGHGGNKFLPGVGEHDRHTGRIQIPALAATRPDRLAKPCLYILNEGRYSFRGGFNLVCIAVAPDIHQPQHVVQLFLRHTNHRVVADGRARAEHQEVVGEVFHEYSVIAGVGAVLPCVVDGMTRASYQAARAHIGEVVESCCQHDNVEGDQLSCDQAHAISLNTFDAVGNQVGIVFLYRRVEREVDHHALTTNAVIRRELLA